MGKQIWNRIMNSLGLVEEVDDDTVQEAMEEAGIPVKEEPVRKQVPAAKPSRPVTRLDDHRKEETKPAKKPSLLSRVRGGKDEVKAIPVNRPMSQVNMVVMEPVNFNESQKVADYLKNSQPVVLNFEKTDPQVKKRMSDCIAGVLYALNGSLKPIGKNILVCAPRHVDIDAESAEQFLRNGSRQGDSGQEWKRK